MVKYPLTPARRIAFKINTVSISVNRTHTAKPITGNAERAMSNLRWLE
jgi:hypothetical protein